MWMHTHNSFLKSTLSLKEMIDWLESFNGTFEHITPVPLTYRVWATVVAAYNYLILVLT